MKNLFKIALPLALFSSVVLSSCLKDSSLTLDTSKSNNVTEFANTGSIATNPSGDAAPRYAIDLGALKVGDTTGFNINVDYAGADKAPQDIKVTIDIDESLLATYNTEHAVDGADYVIPPSSLITTAFPLTITIPKGQLFGQQRLAVKLPADYDFNASYALPLKISATSVGVVSGNFGTALYSLNVRNIFDGEFTVTGTYVDLQRPDFGPVYPKTIYLSTLGAASNGYFDPNLNGGIFGYTMSGGYYGSWAPVFTFAADGTITSVTNYYGQPAGNGRSGQLDPSGVNKMTFDADGKPKEINVSYFMLQPGSTVRCKFTEKFVYKGARP